MRRARCPQKRERRGFPRRSDASGQRPYTHFGSPSLLAGASDVEPTYTEQVLVVVVCVTVAVKPSAVTAMVGPTTPVVVEYAVPRLLVYFTESARYAFSFVFANFGIAIAAKMPMITTTIRSSISVKPLRFIWTNLPCKVQPLAIISAPWTSTNHALDRAAARKQNCTNRLTVRKCVSHRLKKVGELRLFARHHARRKRH